MADLGTVTSSVIPKIDGSQEPRINQCTKTCINLYKSIIKHNPQALHKESALVPYPSLFDAEQFGAFGLLHLGYRIWMMLVVVVVCYS